MSHACVIWRRQLLLLGVVLASILATAGAAHAEGFGEITRFGGPGSAAGELTPSVFNNPPDSFKFRPWHVIGVEPKTNDVFVLEEYKESTLTKVKKVETSTRYLRLQEFSSENGKLLGSAELSVATLSEGEGVPFKTEQIQGIAVDAEAGRLYFLVTAERTEEVRDENEAAADSLYAYKTTPNGSKELEPVAEAGWPVGPEKLKPTSEEPGVALLQPHGITVDPHTHEVIIGAHVDTTKCPEEEPGEPECEPDKLGSTGDHYVTQRVKENGELGEQVVDTGNVLKQQKGEGFYAPGSPVVVGSGAAERTLMEHLIQPEPSTYERTVAEFPTSGSPKQLVLPDTGGSKAEKGEGGFAENGFDEVIEEPEGDIGGSLAVSPEGTTLYGVTKIENEEVSGSHERLYAISERSAETLQPIGWTGGQRADSSDSCVLEPGIYEGEHIQLAAGKNGDVFVLVPEYLREPGQGSFPTHDAIVEFGPGGKGCPAALTEKNVALVGGKETTGPVATGQPVTLSTFVKQGDALSVTWKIENETTKSAPVTHQQTEDQYQTPKLVETFSEGGTYKITEEIKTDNLETPTLTVPPRTLVVEEKKEPPSITLQPEGKTVTAGEIARFTALAKGKPAPSPQWWVVHGGKEEEDKADAGSKTTNLEVKATEADSGNKYFAVFTDGATGEKATTNKVTLTVNPPPTGPGPGTPPPSPPPTTNTPFTPPPEGGVLPVTVVSPKATIAGTSALVSASGALSLKVSCLAGATTCSGTVTLRTANAVVATAKKKPAILTLALGSFSLPGGQTKTITLHLSAQARKLLAKAHVLHARATVVSHDPAGGTVTAAGLITLRPAPAKHKG